MAEKEFTVPVGGEGSSRADSTSTTETKADPAKQDEKVEIGNEPGNQVSPHFQKLLTEKKNWAEKARQLEAELKARDEKSLIEKEEWKTLAENRQKELDEYKTQVETFQNTLKTEKKKEALKTELSKLGFDQKYFTEGLVAEYMPKLKIDEDTGFVGGAVEVAQSLKEKFQPLFGGAAVGVNNSAPSTGQPLSLEQWRKLPPEEKAKRAPEIKNQLGL